MSKVKTGISGFDGLLKGGFPQNKTILLSGTPGTCKTIFGLQYIYNGVTQFSEKGLYISFEESKESLLSQAKQFGWDFSKTNRAKIISYPVNSITANTVNEIIDLVKKFKAKRVVIDSVSALSLNSPTTFSKVTELTDIAIKRFMYHFINDLKLNVDATTLLIAQSNDDNLVSRDSVSEFVCDGIVLIYYESMGGAFSRSIQIRKMREADHDDDIYPLEVSGNGLVVHKEES